MCGPAELTGESAIAGIKLAEDITVELLYAFPDGAPNRDIPR